MGSTALTHESTFEQAYAHMRTPTRELQLKCILFGLAVQGMMSAVSAIFTEPQLLRGSPLVLGRRVISPFTL